jgi:hypothetical protein
MLLFVNEEKITIWFYDSTERDWDQIMSAGPYLVLANKNHLNQRKRTCFGRFSARKD